MFLGVLLIAAGGFLVFQAAKHCDAGRRAHGQGRLNNILTDFGGGSFKEGVAATVSEKAHGCLSTVFFVLGLICILHGCAELSGNGAEDNNDETSISVEARTR